MLFLTLIKNRKKEVLLLIFSSDFVEFIMVFKGCMYYVNELLCELFDKNLNNGKAERNDA